MKNLMYITVLVLGLIAGANGAVAQTPQPSKTAIKTVQKPLERPTGYGTMLFKMVLALILTCVLAVVILKWGMKKLVTHSSKDDQMKILARMAVEPRRQLLVVQVGTRTLVLGSSESGMELLTELHGQDAETFRTQTDDKHARTTHQKRAFSLPSSSATSRDTDSPKDDVGVVKEGDDL